MSLIYIEAESARKQRYWVYGALALALVIHLFFAGAMAWYKIKGLEVPFDHSQKVGPFTVKRIEINPQALKPDELDPTSIVPPVEPPSNPSQFNLDPHLVEKALQTPQPTLSTPSMPEASKVIATTDLSQSLPAVESDSAKITAELSQFETGTATHNSQTSSKLAQDLINSMPGPPQPGQPGGPVSTGNDSGAQLPGFAQLAPTFHASTSVSNLPEPVLLRLPSDVLFDFDSAILKPEADPLLTQAIGLIKKTEKADIQIDGYSDSFGKPDYNLALSDQRAQAVQVWLENHIPELNYKFHSKGHGSTNYVVSSQGTIDQQQPNRRVEILIQALKP